MEKTFIPHDEHQPLPWLADGKSLNGSTVKKNCHNGEHGMSATFKETTFAYPFSAIFPHANHMPVDIILMGIILSIAFGFAAGNYACSLVHRLPRGLGILEKKPYCGSCNTMLATKDLFPVISAMLLKHKCRYCGAPIPKSHFYTELLIGLLFCLCYLVWGFTEPYYLIALLGSMLVVLASIHANEGMVDKRVLLAGMFTGMLYRVFVDGTIYGFFYGGLFALIIGCVLWYKKIEKRGHIFVPPLQALLLTIGGICVGSKGLIVFLPAYAVLYFIFSLFKSKTPSTVPFGLAVIISLILA